VVLTTLNKDSLVARVTGMRWSMIAHGHFTYWNEQSLRELHRRAGLEIKRVGFFGLGRDLVALVDRLASLGRETRASHGSAPGAGLSWDSRVPVLLAERALNRFLDRTRLGVGIIVESQRDSNFSGV
jgi:hypothetical protein